MTGLPHLKIALFSLTTLLALTACEQAGEPPTGPPAPPARIQRHQGAYDPGSLSPSLFVGGRRPAERKAHFYPRVFRLSPDRQRGSPKESHPRSPMAASS